MERFFDPKGLLLSIIGDSNSGSIDKIIDEHIYIHGNLINFLHPSKPAQNCSINKIHKRLRDEYLNEHRYLKVHHARELKKQDYQIQRGTAP